MYLGYFKKATNVFEITNKQNYIEHINKLIERSTIDRIGIQLV